ncbi:Cirhin, partial [Toxocara canis]
VSHQKVVHFQRSQVCAAPIWCLATISVHSFCAGTDSGAVFFLDFIENQVNVIKTVNIGFGCRVLSLVSDGSVLAAGSLDAVHLIDVDSASIRHSLQLPRVEKRKPTVVWCVVFIERTLASGDSRGCVCFWNCANGALVQTVQTHQADVLSLCVAGDALYAAGVDPSIARLNHNKQRTLWRVEHRRVLHKNDVRALVASRTALFSGGAEHHFIGSTKNKHHSALKLTPCKTAVDADLFMYEYLGRIVIWRTALAEAVASSKGRFALKKEPEKLVEIRLPHGEHVFSSAITDDGHFIAIAKLNSVVVYSLDDLTTWKVKSVRVIETLPVRASSLVFCSHTLVIASDGFALHTVCLSDRSASVAQRRILQEGAGEVVRLHANHSASKVVALTTRNNLYIADLSMESLRKLDVHVKSVLMDAQFMNDTTLFILCADNERTLLEYSLLENSLSEKAISKETLSMAADELVMDMEARPEGTIVVGSKGTLRVIDARQRKRMMLLVAGATEAVPGVQRPDRCLAARWLPGRSLMVCASRVLSEPSLGAFRAKRYGQN